MKAGVVIAGGLALMVIDVAARACVPSFDPVTSRTSAELNAACKGGDALACRRAKRIVRACALGDLFSCERILDEPSFRAYELALVSIRTHCLRGDAGACARLGRDERFGPDARLTAEEGRCLLGVAGACSGWPEPHDATPATPEVAAAPLPTDSKACNGDAVCLSRLCVEGIASSCLEACRAADPSSCALLESEDFDPRPLARPLEQRCKRGETAACVSVWALNGAHVCSRSRISAERFASGRDALARACAQGWDDHQCDLPLPDQTERF